MSDNKGKKNKTITVMLKLTGLKCNMSCDYCYEKDLMNQKKYKINATADEAIDYLSKYKNYEHVYIIFHGGEPLLMEKEIFSKVVYYIRENFTGVWNIQVQTNGTLIDKEWLDIFHKIEQGFSLSISLDPSQDNCRNVIIDDRNVIVENLKKSLVYINNVGIVSVVHRKNIDQYLNFINELREYGVKNLTINKFHTDSRDKSELFISEMEYVNFIKQLINYWISSGLYNKMSIQPLRSLFAKKNKLCIYLADEKKCSYFNTFYNKDFFTSYCDHAIDELPVENDKCKKCDIYFQCGGGCLLENKDDTFCIARHELINYINNVKGENS